MIHSAHPQGSTICKNDLKWIRDLNMKCKTIKLLEGNMEECLLSVGQANISSQDAKQKRSKVDFSRMLTGLYKA